MTTLGDKAVVVTSVFVMVFIAVLLAHEHGYQQGSAAKECASVKGERVVSSTADSCTYVAAYGRATRTRRAM